MKKINLIKMINSQSNWWENIKNFDIKQKDPKFKVGDLVLFKTQKHLDPQKIMWYYKESWQYAVWPEWHWWTEDELELYKNQDTNIKTLADFKKLEVWTYLRNVFAFWFRRETLWKVAKIVEKNTTWFNLEYINLNTNEIKNKKLEFPTAKNFYVNWNRVYISSDIWLILVYDILWKEIEDLQSIEKSNIIFDISLKDINSNNVVWVQNKIWLIQTNKEIFVFENKAPFDIFFKWDRLDLVYISDYNNKNQERNMIPIYIVSNNETKSWLVIYDDVFKKFDNMKLAYNKVIDKNLILWDWKYYEFDYFRKEFIEYNWKLDLDNFKTEQQIDNERKEKQKQEDIKNKKEEMIKIETININNNSEENIKKIEQYLKNMWMQVDNNGSLISDLSKKDIFIRTSNLNWIKEKWIIIVTVFKLKHIEISEDKKRKIKQQYNEIVNFLQSINQDATKNNNSENLELDKEKLKKIVNEVNNKIGNRDEYNITVVQKDDKDDKNTILSFETDGLYVFIINISLKNENIKIDNDNKLKIDIQKLIKVIDKLPQNEKQDFIEKINNIDNKYEINLN